MRLLMLIVPLFIPLLAPLFAPCAAEANPLSRHLECIGEDRLTYTILPRAYSEFEIRATGSSRFELTKMQPVMINAVMPNRSAVAYYSASGHEIASITTHRDSGQMEGVIFGKKVVCHERKL